MSILLIPVLVWLATLLLGIWTVCRIFPAQTRHAPDPPDAPPARTDPAPRREP
ncbi:hypothetical protein [Brachybacterium sp. UNK5269]|uniref:hypothetical protein n=1 Tax=Brachybacterium sp. UNK5269 TaxID=3408576 RepID=UPI003BB12009